jgi:hypothetical protein
MVISAALFIGSSAYHLVTYSTPFNFGFQFRWVTGNATETTEYLWLTNLAFQADGPISVGRKVTLTFIQLFGEPPNQTDHVALRIIGVFPHILVNESLPPRWGDLGYYFNESKTASFTNTGIVNVSALLSFWGNGKLLLSLVSLAGAPSPFVTTADAWTAYETQRITLAVAIGSFVFAGLPTGLKSLRDLTRTEGRRE